MKKIGLIFLSIILLFISSCASYAIRDLSIVEDDFTGDTITSREILIISEEVEGSPLVLGFFKVVSKISSEGNDQYIYFTLDMNATAADLDSKGFLKIDDELIEITFVEQRSDNATDVGSSTSQTYNPATGAMEQQTTNYSINYKKMSGKIVLTSELITKLQDSSEFKIRLYSASEFISFAFTEEPLIAVQSVFN